MLSPSDHTATLAGFRRNAWLASIGIGGWFRSELMAGFVGIHSDFRPLNNSPPPSVVADGLEGGEFMRNARPWQGAADLRGALHLQGEDAEFDVWDIGRTSSPVCFIRLKQASMIQAPLYPSATSSADSVSSLVMTTAYKRPARRRVRRPDPTRSEGSPEHPV